MASLRCRLCANDIVSASRDADRMKVMAPNGPGRQSAVRSPDFVALRQIVPRTHQLDVFGYERGAAARVRDYVVEMEVVAASAFDTLALVARPHGQLHFCRDKSVLFKTRFARSTTGVASGSTSRRNLNTNRPFDSSRQPSTSRNMPLNIQMPVRIFSYTRTRSAGVPCFLCCEAARRKRPF